MQQISQPIDAEDSCVRRGDVPTGSVLRGKLMARLEADLVRKWEMSLASRMMERDEGSAALGEREARDDVDSPTRGVMEWSLQPHDRRSEYYDRDETLTRVFRLTDSRKALSQLQHKTPWRVRYDRNRLGGEHSKASTEKCPM
jgi:hypothetical protein